jgi:hypothetical protein
MERPDVWLCRYSNPVKLLNKTTCSRLGIAGKATHKGDWDVEPLEAANQELSKDSAY